MTIRTQPLEYLVIYCDEGQELVDSRTALIHLINFNIIIDHAHQ